MQDRDGSTPRERPGYQPALDGIRALAVAAVVAFHGGVTALEGGFLGVDAFFVLSGYLITSLLLVERARTGRIRLGAFWARRARRLLPALLLVVAAVAVGARLLLPAEEVGLVRADALAALLYVANWRMIDRGGDYFAATASPSPLQHAWSLGIEEQFYLLWPLVLLGVLALTRRRRAGLVAALGVCVLGVAASTVASVVLYRPLDPGRAYYGSDTRAAPLLVGCALALALDLASTRRRPAHVRPGLRPLLGTAAAAGALVTVAAWLGLAGDDPVLWHGGLLAVAVAVAAVVAHAVVAPTGVTAWLLSRPPLPLLGRVSYGVYLWHWPIFQAVNADRTGLSGPALLALRCAVTLVLTAASYVLVERPIRAGRWLRPRLRPVATVAAVALTAVVALFATTVPTPPTTAPVLGAPVPPPSVAAGPSPGEVASVLTRPGRPAGRPPRVTVFGDSVAWSLASQLPSYPGLQVTDRAIQGCGIARLSPVRDAWTVHPPYARCPRWDASWADGVRRDDPDVALVVLARWETMDRKLNGRWRHIGQPDFDAYLRSELERMIAILTARGARVLLATAPYSRRHEKPDGSLYVEDTPERMDAWNAMLRAVAAAHPDAVGMIDLAARVCPDGRFTWSAGGVRIRSDGLHFTATGVRRWIAPWLLPRLAGAVS